MNKKNEGKVVRIDSSLLKKVERILTQEENRLKFANKKHFIDTAVNEFLKEIEKNEK